MDDERRRAWVRLAAPLTIICVSAASAACAPTAPYNPDRLPPAQISRIGQICHTVMGLPAGLTTHYLSCVESLSRSLAARRERSGATAAHGLDERPPAPPATSYFLASNREVHRRAQEACVAIGEGPSPGAFGQCVADLEGALFDADNPIWHD